jgi:hypothetical protein
MHATSFQLDYAAASMNTPAACNAQRSSSLDLQSGASSICLSSGRTADSKPFILYATN